MTSQFFLHILHIYILSSRQQEIEVVENSVVPEMTTFYSKANAQTWDYK